MVAIGAIELVALLVGFSPSASVDAALPGLHTSGPELDAAAIDGHGAELGPLSHTLSWLSVGRVPLLVLLVVALSSFAIAGYLVQWTATGLLGGTLHAGFASILALVAAAYSSRWLGRWLGRILPKDQTEAASRNDLIGSYATILRGTATKGRPAEAKTADLRGRSHYVLIEPKDPEVSYAAGDRVFIVGLERNVYRAIHRLDTQQE